MTQPIPALVVSGFLGSGKTTLVQHLLEQAQEEGTKLAIISNELGDVGIDRALLDAGEEGLVELEGGCVCCRLSDALGETLEMLLTKVQPDRLILETSGVALPGEILVQFWRPPIDDLISEEVVVVVVDGEFFLRERPTDEAFISQLEAADLVVLNKCDLLEEESIVGAEGFLDEITGGQPILRAEFANIEPALLFPPDPDGARRSRRDGEATLRDHSHEQYVTVELSFPGTTTESKVKGGVYYADALRAKGFVRFSDGIHLVQTVGPRMEIVPSPVPNVPE
ncbi:MAG: GTP-binding protein, partial [Deltaproteobacteria bacterium]|nr:GTP-binding protein [Deltaproteobacteria bacterium]